MQDELYEEGPRGAVAIPLKRRDGSVRAYAWVSKRDYKKVTKFRWYLHGGSNAPYAAAKMKIEGEWQTVLMHRFLLGLVKGDPRECDHRDRDRLNNTRRNLRIATHAENMQNVPTLGGTAGYRGVTFCERTGRWRAMQPMNNKKYWLGRFDTPEEAHEAVVEFRRQHMPFSEEAA